MVINIRNTNTLSLFTFSPKLTNSHSMSSWVMIAFVNQKILARPILSTNSGKLSFRRKKGVAIQFCRFQFEVPLVRYNAQLLYPRLSCHHEPALKGLLRNCRTKERPKLRPNCFLGHKEQLVTHLRQNAPCGSTGMSRLRHSSHNGYDG